MNHYKSQCEKIFKHLQTKTLTSIDALNLYGCFRLAARISDLRDAGHTIITETINKNGKRFARYKLVQM